jgi:hypothetical protein
VLTFSNNHLMYAMTWFGLAFMLFRAVVFARIERWPRQIGANGLRSILQMVSAHTDHFEPLILVRHSVLL